MFLTIDSVEIINEKNIFSKKHLFTQEHSSVLLKEIKTDSLDQILITPNLDEIISIDKYISENNVLGAFHYIKTNRLLTEQIIRESTNHDITTTILQDPLVKFNAFLNEFNTVGISVFLVAMLMKYNANAYNATKF
jgi:hypothetical protein